MNSPYVVDYVYNITDIWVMSSPDSPCLPLFDKSISNGYPQNSCCISEYRKYPADILQLCCGYTEVKAKEMRTSLISIHSNTFLN
jgi:hypothetical protein